MARNKTQVLIRVSFLIAMEVILSRLCSFTTPIAKISFAFLPIAICGILYGPMWAGLAGGLSDIIGVMLFPVAGPIFPGFTVSAVLNGTIYGALLHNHEPSWGRLLAAVILTKIGISLCLSTFWLTCITSVSFSTLISIRIVQNLIMLPIQLLMIRVFQVKIRVLGKTY